MEEATPMVRRTISLSASIFALLTSASSVFAQSFGVELQNSMMPASGGMAGASISRPQDLQSAVNANPATLRQFQGTQFSFGGGWADATYQINQAAPLPLIGVLPFDATSATPGALVGNIGVTQDLGVLGLPATLGMALVSNAGVGVDFRGVPESNGTSAQFLCLEMVNSIGFDITERLSAGASFQLGTAYMDGPFTSLGGMAADYGARGTLGANYLISENTSFGTYWQTQQHFDFQNAIQFPIGGPRNIVMDLPSNVGLGLANSSLMDGKLLLAFDVVFKQWSATETFGQVYDDQWVYQWGAQYSITPKTRLRMGYAYNENPMRGAGSLTVGNVVLPDGIPAMRYIEGQFAVITQHRITLGVGVSDVLIPGLDFDLFAGHSFAASDTFGTTSVAISDNYWLGFGATWRFGSGNTH